MLATRIIPTLLQRGASLVKGTGFNSWRSVGHALQAIKIHNLRGVDELIYLDIGATPEGRGPDIEMVSRLTETFFSPLTVGGGVRTLDDVRNLLAAGADKVSIRSEALRNPSFILEASDRFGAQAIVVSIDEMNGEAANDSGPTGLGVADWAKRCEEYGAGEILLTSVERDGTMQGYDIELIKTVSNAVDIPVIAAGGCSGYEDMYNAIQAGASAVAAGALFQFTDCTPKGAAEYLKARGVTVRDPR